MTVEAAASLWRFGESEEDAVAWAHNPGVLHVYVDVRTPTTPVGCWHRVWAVTEAWTRTHVKPGSVFPPLLVIHDGSLEEMRAEVDLLVKNLAPMIALNGSLLPADHKTTDW